MVKQYNSYGNNNYGNKGKGGTPKSKNHVTTDFYNPYSFVGLRDSVLTLDDSEDNNEVENLDYVNDVPFEEGYSGKINVEFESLTRFCVLGSGEHNTNIDGRYYVPGSSLKGMIRSIFEIITFSDIKNGIDDNRYSMRNLHSDDYELKAANAKQKSGFLFRVNGDYYIQECDNTRYLYEDTKGETTDIKSIFRNLNIFDFKKAKVEKKYKLINNNPYRLDSDGNDAMWFFSGPMMNKKHEFLFSIPEFSEALAIKIDDRVWDDFLFIHEKENENEAWKYWRKGRLKNVDDFSEVDKTLIVPCFFRKSNGKIIDFGFSYLYRQPYNHTIHQCLPDNVRRNKGIDLTQTVFGYVNKNNALKGRVFVGNSLMDESVRPGVPQTFILGGPKPTYFPFYLKQNANGKLNTYFSKGAQISGYKRYLVHDRDIDGNIPESSVTSTFYPMPANTKFSTTIYFHNLLDYELGALLSAITFCQNQDKCFHSLGYAKPFGYGKIRVNKCELSYIEANKPENDSHSDDKYFYNAFKQLIANCDLKVDLDYVLADLMMIARGTYQPNKEIRYPKSGMDKATNDKNNEFVAIQSKENHFNIKDFSPNK